MGLIRSRTTEVETDKAASASAGRGSSGRLDSLISADMVLDGDCHTDGQLRVDGEVKGDVRAARLVVGQSGRIGGTVTGRPNGSGDERTVVIDGRVEGAVDAPYVEVGPTGTVGGGMRVKEALVRGRVAGGIQTEGRLLLEETAIVEGDVVAGRLGLKEGGQVFGTIRIGEAPTGARKKGEGSKSEGSSTPEGEGSRR
jgi:cytoskeletal protein CcmA (bactofilin family)